MMAPARKPAPGPQPPRQCTRVGPPAAAIDFMVATLVGSGAARLTCPAIKATENVLAIAVLKILIAALLFTRAHRHGNRGKACSDRPYHPMTCFKPVTTAARRRARHSVSLLARGKMTHQMRSDSRGLAAMREAGHRMAPRVRL